MRRRCNSENLTYEDLVGLVARYCKFCFKRESGIVCQEEELGEEVEGGDQDEVRKLLRKFWGKL